MANASIDLVIEPLEPAYHDQPCANPFGLVLGAVLVGVGDLVKEIGTSAEQEVRSDVEQHRRGEPEPRARAEVSIPPLARADLAGQRAVAQLNLWPECAPFGDRYAASDTRTYAGARRR